LARREEKTLAGLQVMRAVAALMVAVHHAMEAARAHSTQPMSPDWLTTAGAAGVDIFFVISGFIMMVVAFPPGRAPERPWPFLRKRIARIYPFYWATLLGVLFLFGIGASTIVPNPNLTLDHLVRALFLAPSNNLPIGVSWTLVHEMNFYLLFTVMLFFGNRALSLIGVSALLVLQLILAPFVPDSATALTLGRPIALEFAFGLALGYVYLRRGALRVHWSITAAAFSALLLAPLFIAHASTGGLDADDRVWAWGLPAIILVGASLNWNVGHDRWSKAWMLMGDASYAIYLLHPYVVWMYAKVLVSSNAAAQAPQLGFIIIASLLCAAVGVAAHLLVELPLTQAARRLISSKPAKRTEPRAAV
jgi:exopolysaccharide production protein ExoZ